jgi:hypothetical protein
MRIFKADALHNLKFYVQKDPSPAGTQHYYYCVTTGLPQWG